MCDDKERHEPQKENTSFIIIATAATALTRPVLRGVPQMSLPLPRKRQISAQGAHSQSQRRRASRSTVFAFPDPLFRAEPISFASSHAPTCAPTARGTLPSCPEQAQSLALRDLGAPKERAAVPT